MASVLASISLVLGSVAGDLAMSSSSSYDKFIFNGDGTYNGMIRTGTFTVLGKLGETIFTGDYKCDNSNLKMDFTNEDGQRGTILALVRSFTETTLIISYEAEELGVSGIRVQMTLRKEG